ncbi:hypothetical protein MBLNU230_g4934t1 [Neophaeotheca triangularis]
MNTPPEDFPLPQVAEALNPFIKPREEVKAIRQNLQAYLESHLETSDTPLTAVTLYDATLKDPSRAPPEALSGVRKAYYCALQSHTAAQTRYESLKADLERLGRSEVNHVSDQWRGEPTEVADYVKVLRQRRKLRELRAVERALDETTATGDELLAAGLEESVGSQVGQSPTPPVLATIAPDVSGVVEERVVELKKAILITQSSVEAIRAKSGNSNSDQNSKDELHAIQAAHGQLSQWIEQQLAIISETETSPDNSNPQQSRHSPNQSQNTPDIETLYNNYLTARRQILQTLTTPPTPHSNPDSPIPQPPNTSHTLPSLQTSNPATILLPHLPSLLSTSTSQSSHSITTTHLRRTLASSTEAHKRLFARLADESHLVPPGVEAGEAWLRAGVEARRELENFVGERVEEGVSAVEEGWGSLAKMEVLREGVGRVVEGR